MSSENTSFTIDVLGEEIKDLDEARYFVEEYSRVLDEIISHGINAHISLKPTAFGLLLDKDIAIANIEEILDKAAMNNIFVRLDMEDHRVTQDTIDIVLLMQEKGHQITVFSSVYPYEHKNEKYSDFQEVKGIKIFRINKSKFVKKQLCIQKKWYFQCKLNLQLLDFKIYTAQMQLKTH